MNKIKILLDIEKHINILEEFGDYRSAKVLHGKFVRIAQTQTFQNQPIDPKANAQQNDTAQIILDSINDANEQNRLQRIKSISESLSFNNQITELQKTTLKSYADELISEKLKSTSPQTATTEAPSAASARMIDLEKQFNPLSNQADNRPIKYQEYGDGRTVEIRTNPDYTEDRIFTGPDGFRKLYKNTPPEMQLVNYQGSPGNWTTTVLPKGMNPQMAYPAYREYARTKSWENSIPGYSEFLRTNPNATATQKRNFIESDGTSSTSSTKTTGSDGLITTEYEITARKKFTKIAQDSNSSSTSASSSTPTATPSSPNQAPAASSDGTISSQQLNDFEKALFPDTPTGLWSKLLLMAIQQNIGLSQALDSYAGSGAQFNGKPLATHVNYGKLKQKLSAIQPSKQLTRYNRQYGFMVLGALTDYVLDQQLLSYLAPPEGYEFPENMAGKPLKLNIYEKTGLFRSSYPQERMFIFQKIRQLDPNSGFTGNGILPRIQ
jgi:hypothetical protein